MDDNEKLDRIAEDCAATRAHITNLKEHILAVNNNVREVRTDFNAHKESVDAHGRKASEGTLNQVVTWLSFAVAAILGINEIRKH